MQFCGGLLLFLSTFLKASLADSTEKCNPRFLGFGSKVQAVWEQSKGMWQEWLPKDIRAKKKVIDQTGNRTQNLIRYMTTDGLPKSVKDTNCIRIIATE